MIDDELTLQLDDETQFSCLLTQVEFHKGGGHLVSTK